MRQQHLDNSIVVVVILKIYSVDALVQENNCMERSPDVRN